MSWETFGERPAKGMRRHLRQRKAALRREQALELCTNSSISKADRARARQAAERERQAEVERARREAERQANVERSRRRFY